MAFYSKDVIVDNFWQSSHKFLSKQNTPPVMDLNATNLVIGDVVIWRQQREKKMHNLF